MKIETPNKKKSSYHHGNLKEELLTNAIELVQEHGLEALTLNVLAKRLDISAPALYRHFSSKNDLINNVIAFGFDTYDNLIIEISRNYKNNMLEKLYFIGKAYINFAIENPNLFKLLFGNNYHETRDYEDPESTKALYVLVNTLIEAQEKNIIKKEEPLLQAVVMHSTVHGITSLYLNNYAFIKTNIHNIYDSAFETVLTGILVDSSNLKEEIRKIKK